MFWIVPKSNPDLSRIISSSSALSYSTAQRKKFVVSWSNDGRICRRILASVVLQYASGWEKIQSSASCSVVIFGCWIDESETHSRYGTCFSSQTFSNFADKPPHAL